MRFDRLWTRDANALPSTIFKHWLILDDDEELGPHEVGIV
jgi:hypothetical protein